MELPKIDLDKINKYLLQTSIKKHIQGSKESVQKRSGVGNLKFSEILPGQDIKSIGGASRNCLIDAEYHYANHL